MELSQRVAADSWRRGGECRRRVLARHMGRGGSVGVEAEAGSAGSRKIKVRIQIREVHHFNHYHHPSPSDLICGKGLKRGSCQGMSRLGGAAEQGMSSLGREQRPSIRTISILSIFPGSSFTLFPGYRFTTLYPWVILDNEEV